MTLFTEVDARSFEGDTSRMFNLKNENLYDIQTMVTIGAPEKVPREFDVPPVHLDKDKERLCISIGSVVHIFTVGLSPKLERSHTFEANVRALKILSSQRQLAVELVNGTVAFCGFNESVEIKDDCPGFVSGLLASASECLGSDHEYIFWRRAGTYVFALTSDNVMHVIDSVFGVACRVLDLRLNEDFNDKFLRFEFLDVDEFEMNFNNIKLLLLVQKPGGNCEFQIRSFESATKKCDYRIRVCERAVFANTSTDGDNAVIVIDPFSHKHSDQVLIRYITEAQPQLRLEKLIMSLRFDDAEEFATLYNLPLEPIHHRRAMDLVGQLCDDDSVNDDLLTTIFDYCNKMSNKDDVADLCVHAINSAMSFTVISRFLDFASTLPITDKDTSFLLGELDYHFRTFTIICQDATHFDPELWQLCITDSKVVWQMFQAAWLQGCESTARIIWSRYRTELEQISVKDANTLNFLEDLVVETPNILEGMIEFVQEDFGPFFLSLATEAATIKKHCQVLVDFILNVAKAIARVDAANFPANSLNVCRIMERIFKNVCKNNTSPDGTAVVFKQLGYSGAASFDENTPIGQLNIRKENLEKMAVLKEKYNLHIDYESYVQSSVEAICFKILDLVDNTRGITQHIHSFGVPYMTENGLKKDCTLLNYIENVSLRASALNVKATDPWDEMCIAVISSIDNVSLRCQAVIKIAQRSSIPWSHQLQNIVKQVHRLTDLSQNLKQDLEIECHREVLGKIFLRFDVPLAILNQTMTAYSCERYIRSLFVHGPGTLAERKAEITEAARLMMIIFKCNFDVEQVVANGLIWAAHVAIGHGNTSLMREAIALIDCTTRLLHAFNVILSTCREILNDASMWMAESRLHCIDTVLIINQNCPQKLEGLPELVNIGMRLRKLQEVYGIVLTYSDLLHPPDGLFEELFNIRVEAADANTNYEDLFSFASCLGLSKQDAFFFVVEKVGYDLGLVAELIVGMTRDPDNLEARDVDGALMTLRQFFFYLFSACEKRLGNDDVCKVIGIIRLLHSAVPQLSDAATRLQLLQQFEMICLLDTFFNFFNRVLTCCMDLPEEVSNDARQLESRIYGMRSRFGILVPEQVGYVYDGSEVVRLMAQAGASIFVMYSRDESLVEELHNADLTRCWDGLLNSMRSHPYFFLETLILGHKIPSLKASLEGIPEGTFELCQKVVTAPEIDIELIAQTLFTLKTPDEMQKIILELLRWAEHNQNSRAVYYLSMVAQLAIVLFNVGDGLKPVLIDIYRQAWWTRRFAKENIKIRNIRMSEQVHEDMLAALGSPYLYKQYCGDHDLDTDSMLFAYAIDLLRNSGREANLNRFTTAINLANASFEMVCTTTNAEVFERAREAMKQLCPYNYEALDMLVAHMTAWAGTENDKVLVLDFKRVISFLGKYERHGGFTNAEYKWYSSWQRSLANHAAMADSMDFEMEKSNSMSDMSYSTAEKAFPAVASKRLPFHILFYREHEKVIAEIVNPEITLANVTPWVELITACPKSLPISRTSLIVAAIMNRIRLVISQRSEIFQSDLDAIASLLQVVTVKLGSLQRLATELYGLPACMDRIKVYGLFRDLGRKWIETMNLDSKSRESIKDCVNMIRRVMRQEESKLVLDELCIECSDKNMLRDGHGLIKFILNNHIDWNCRTDILKKMELTRRIASIHRITLEEVLEHILQDWLRGNDNVVGYLKPVITGGTAFTGSMGTSITDGELFPMLPFNDVDVVRIAYILKELNSRTTCLAVANHLLDKNCEQSLPLLMKRLRILCVFARCLDERQYKEIFNSDISLFSQQLRTLILQFAFKVVNLDVTLEQYASCNKLNLVKSLINAQGGVRQSVETFQLAAVIVMDWLIADEGIIERILTRLCRMRSFERAQVFIAYINKMQCRQLVDKFSDSYLHVFEALFESIDPEADDSSYRALIHFALGCPSSKASAGSFKRAVLNLEKCNFPVAARMLAAAAGIPHTPASMAGQSNSRDIQCDSLDALRQIGRVMVSEGVSELTHDPDGSQFQAVEEEEESTLETF